MRKRAVAIVLLTIMGATVLAWRIDATQKIIEELGAARLVEAQAILEGHSRCGLTNYTHNPIGTAYLLVPFLWLGWPAWWIPAGGFALITVAAFGTALWWSDQVWWAGIVSAFVAWCWQPGVIAWVGNYLECWALSMVLLAFVAAVWTQRPVWLVALGFTSGWITYETLHLQILALVVAGLATHRRLWPLSRSVLAFTAGVIGAVATHWLQVVCYFGSVAAAQADLSGDTAWRLSGGWAMRTESLWPLVHDYSLAFVTSRWSHLPTLLLAVVIGIGTWAVACRRARWSPVARSLLIALCCIGSVPAWFFITPGYNLPHLHLFPRQLFAPLIVLAYAVPMAMSRRRKTLG